MTLVESCDNEWYIEESIITFNKRMAPRKQLYSVLHECGHYLIFNSSSYKKLYKAQILARTDKRKRSLEWRINFLKEEFDAWQRGKQLARDLKIDINEKDYDKYASECLKTYCMWVVDKEWRKWDCV